MRASGHIQELWAAGGPFIGDNGRPNTVVTVQKGWSLQTQTTGLGTWTRSPVRWFHTSQTLEAGFVAARHETRIPNVKTVEIDRSIDTDASTCVITIYNQKMAANGIFGPVVDLGDPGHYNPDRGSATAQTRWGQTSNEWTGVLDVCALIRTYQGFGGTAAFDAWQDDLANDYIVPTGTWLVDTVSYGTDGLLTLRCRDMFALLIDQHVYPPLVPAALYPHGLRYCRALTGDASSQTGSQATPGQLLSTGYGQVGVSKPSSSDAFLGTFDASIDGHRPSHAFDHNDNTYWLSPDNTAPTAPTGVEYIEALGNNASVGTVRLTPWQGGYTIYISVMVNGAWIAGTTAPASTRNTGSNTTAIPYVSTGRLQADMANTFILPTVYNNVQKIRITFTQLTAAGGEGRVTTTGDTRVATSGDPRVSTVPDVYRAGLRTFELFSSGTPPSSNQPNYIANTPVNGDYRDYADIVKEFLMWSGFFLHRVPLNQPMCGIVAPNDGGYWMAAGDGGVFAFGLQFYGSLGSTVLTSPIVGIEATNSGSGYWLVAANGGVTAFGGATSYGSAAASARVYVAIVATPAGAGYWLASAEGGVDSFGDATNHGGVASPATPIVGMAARPQGGGYWLVQRNGTVHNKGSAVHYGDQSATFLNRQMVGIVSTSTGLGYWLVAADGGVFAHGDAVFYGSIGSTFTIAPVVGMTAMSNNSGYWLVTNTGEIFTFGSAVTHGNIDAYSPNQEPHVYGNIESTGAWAPECLTEDQFDKKTVMQVVTMFKEIVGYVAYADEEGAAHFESPNFWARGNFYPDGTHTVFIPEVDETKQLTDYSLAKSADALRSQITIASETPNPDLTDIIQTTYVPSFATLLRGIIRPATWSNGFFTDRPQQETMAELIALHIFFSLRQGTCTAVANPCISPNDQVRIYERVTGETNIHYVRGVSTSHDLDSGEYTMQLTTHWLGNDTFWSLDSPGTLRTARLDSYVASAFAGHATKYYDIPPPRSILATGG